MTGWEEYEAIVAIIEHGIDVARRNPRPDEPVAANDYVAFCILQELRRAGWTVSRDRD
jgi:hypothetical protein